MFAKGGKTKGTDIIKGIQKILGVDDNQMAELWQVGINKYGSEEGIAQALNEATKGLTPQSSPDEVKAAVATVFSTGSEMFKCGGKLQKLAKRFAKGSSIDCGCNGTKLKQNGGLLNNRFYNLPDRVYNEKGVFSGYINGPEDIAYIQSRKEPRDWTVQSPTPQARLNNTTNQSRMLWNPEKLPEPYYTAYVITENPEGKGTVAHVPMNQDGGEVTEAANGVRLTRRQARDLSKQNKGYSNSQYTTAYYNALDALRRNSDLRGKDLRNQARIIASGINVGDNAQIITGPEAVVTPKIVGPQKYTEADTSVGPLKVVAVSLPNETPSIVTPQETEGYTRRPGMEGYVIRPYGPYYTKRANESPVRSYDGSYPNGYERREGMENEIIRPYEVSSSSGYTRRPDATPVIPYGPYYTRIPGAGEVRPLSRQKGGIVKGQTGINSENIDSAPEQVMRIPKYGTIRLLKSRNFAGSEQPDSTFTFAPISKSAYYIPGGTYSRFTNFDGNVETRGYDVGGLNNFTYGETAYNQFNGIRSLWEANKDKRKIVIPKNTGTY